ncbi:MAG: DUF2085 domain-containing protein [Anaerolineae bacterium]|nr:DUF2085 domain-containing protein [Thermoflexales bacterium]MDW8407379.1 DUF2085 domain-containing protein [Anaerolineae bacterium]
MLKTPQRHLVEWTWWPIYALLIVIAVAALLPAPVTRAFDLVGYAVCHRIPDRSFFVAGVQLPLCARDTGMFSAALLGVLSFILVQPKRVNQFPARPYVLVLGGFFAAWAFDGLNSYLLLARGEVFLYTPQNWLRLVTGALMGAALSSFVVPLFNAAVWRPDLSTAQPSVSSWRDMGRLVAVAGIVIGVVLWQPPFLYGPIAAISSLGVIVLLVIVNALLVILLMRREGRIERWSEMTLPLTAGAFFTLTEILVIVLVRAALTEALGLPF